MAMNMPPPSPRTEKRRLTRGTPSKNRSFFSGSASDSKAPRTPADVSWIREQAGSTPRALDRDFLASSPAATATATAVAGGFGVGNAPAIKQAATGPSTTTTKSKMFNRRTWTKEENDRLREGMASLGGPDANLGKQEWATIAHDFLKDSRTGTQCATHWKMVLKPALLKGVWSPEEDKVIYDCVARGVTDWSEMAALLPKRKPKQCRERWNNHLDPSLSKGPPWTAAEDARLVRAVETGGASWSLIACPQLPGRNEVEIQQHWNELVFRNALGGVGSGGGGGGSAGARRGRTGTDASSGGSAGVGGRGKAKASTLPVEPSDLLLGGLGGQDLMPRDSEQQQQQQQQQQDVLLTDREKALMDHAFKTGLSAAAGGVDLGVPPPPQGFAGTVSKEGGVESLRLSTEEDDLFAPLTAALLRDGDGGGGCSPAGMPPPSPTCSPLKSHKYQPDYTSIGDQLGDGWGVDDDPALAELYQSLDNIGESLFNEDTFELSFDFDSVDKPAPSCGGGGGGGGSLASCQKSSLSKGWDSLLNLQEKEGSPFRRAAAKAAATLEHQLSPSKRSSQAWPSKGREIEEACARAAAAAAAAAAATQAAVPQPPTGLASTAAAAAVSIPEPPAGPRVKQGFLRQLLFSAEPEPAKQSPTPFSTVRGCLSEANAPLPPPPPQQQQPPTQPSSSPVAGPGSPVGGSGGENQAPQRRGQPLCVALFAQDPVWSNSGDSCVGTVAPSLKHGKAEVKIPPPQGAAGSGVPLSSLPANRLS